MLLVAKYQHLFSIDNNQNHIFVNNQKGHVIFTAMLSIMEPYYIMEFHQSSVGLDEQRLRRKSIILQTCDVEYRGCKMWLPVATSFRSLLAYTLPLKPFQSSFTWMMEFDENVEIIAFIQSTTVKIKCSFWLIYENVTLAALHWNKMLVFFHKKLFHLNRAYHYF